MLPVLWEVAVKPDPSDVIAVLRDVPELRRVLDDLHPADLRAIEDRIAGVEMTCPRCVHYTDDLLNYLPRV